MLPIVPVDCLFESLYCLLKVLYRTYIGHRRGRN